MTVRPLAQDQLQDFIELFFQLADHDGFGRQNVQTTSDQFQEALFGASPSLHVAVCTENGFIVGFAAWSQRFAARTGRNAMWLSDLFIRPTHRRRGYGRQLMEALGDICKERDFVRIEWKVVSEQPDTEAFYKSLGAGPSAMTLWELPIHKVASA